MKRKDLKLGVSIAVAFFALILVIAAIGSFLFWDKHFLMNWTTLRIATVFGIGWGIYAYLDPDLD